MKSKAPLTLMELLVMVLVFALAVGLCVRIFVTSDLWSRESERRDRAAFAVQNAVEIVKHYHGDLEEAAAVLGVGADDKQLILYYDKKWSLTSEEEAVYDVVVELIDTSMELMGSASVTSHVINGEELFGLTVGWQEVSGNE